MITIIIYDDTGRKSEAIADIIGDKGFADVVVKRKRLEDYYRANLQAMFPDLIWKRLHSAFEYPALIEELEKYVGSDVKVLHCFSNYVITDWPEASLSFAKVSYISEPYGMLSHRRAVAAMFQDTQSYIRFLKRVTGGEHAWDLARGFQKNFEVGGLVDIGNINDFIQCLTGNFESRYFNSLQGNEYTLVKQSSNKHKIRAEYEFWYLLPDDMKYWFVMPFNYEETPSSASYVMERLHMTDLAIKWVHGSMDETEFAELMDRYFFFFKSCHSRTCSAEEYAASSYALYDEKVRKRIAQLKQCVEYKRISRILQAAEEPAVDELVDRYFSLKEKVESKNNYPAQQVIGHGDPCFSNALYNKSTKTLKFIDPKGALSEEELWTNPYYDVAKLSHSVCGNYDFFNNGLYDIRVDDGMHHLLEIPFDNAKYVSIFRRKALENGFDYHTVRVYEVSLFLSMLPLHIDNPYKVFGFILNAKKIIEELERDV